MNWRKNQLDRVQNTFCPQLSEASSDSTPTAITTTNIQTDDDLQPMWKSMENRVKQRRPLTKQERGEAFGRTNVKDTDEDKWLQAGLYDDNEIDNTEEHTNKTVDNGGGASKV
jgi:hypothetical protein